MFGKKKRLEAVNDGSAPVNKIKNNNQELSMKRSKEKISKPVETIDTLIGSGSVLQGDLEFTGGLRVDGHIRGHVSAHDNNNGTLVLSETGVIEGDINVPHVVVNGTVKGNIASKGHVELQANAKIEGDIHYKAVEMELGAVLNGSLVSDSAAPVYDAANSAPAANEEPKKKKLESLS
ncbi:MAG: polymer-forming cytoskeletal protein [Gammaproteobacteria bacterium]|nr:polymer-forming cytoskeletal protein [Gammaproteobacteria bacterium]